MTEILKYNITEEQGEEIDAFINAVSPGAVFHRSIIFKLFNKTRNHTPHYFIRYKNNEIVGLMLATIVQSYPFSVFGRRGLIMQPPIIHPGHAEELLPLLNAFKDDFGAKVFFSEIRNVVNSDIFREEFVSTGFFIQNRINLGIDFGLADTFKKLSESKKRQINKGLEGGAVIEHFKDIHEVRNFYGILKTLYKKKIKKPLPPFSFFEMAFRLGRNSDEIHLVAVKYNRLVIGGMLMAGVSGETFYEWYIGGLHDDYKQLYPSVLATWGGISEAQTLKAKRFDFMGGGVQEVSYGVREFKARFGSYYKESYRWYISSYPRILKLARRFSSKINIG